MLQKRKLGHGGPEVGSLGYGAMVLEGYYGASDDDEAVGTIRRALDLGLTMIDTADAYGNGHNEGLVGRAVAGRRDEAVVATKFGIVFDPDEPGTDLPTGWGFSLKISGRPEYARKALTGSLERLGVGTVDLWYLHYPDPSVPIEETFGAMAHELSVTPAQLALAWLLHQGPDVIPIPGTRRAEHVAENARATEIHLDATQRERMEVLAPQGLAEGATLV